MDKQLTVVGCVDQVPKAGSFGDAGYKADQDQSRCN